MQVSLCEIHMKSDIAVMCRKKETRICVESVGTLIHGVSERRKNKYSGIKFHHSFAKQRE